MISTSDPRARGAARALPLLLALVLLAQAAPPRARARQQEPKEPPPQDVMDEEDVLRIDTDLVLVEVTVTDAEGKPVRGLKAEDFKLFDDGERREVAFVNVERK